MTTWQAVVSKATQTPQASKRFEAALENTQSVGLFDRTPSFVSILLPLAGHAIVGWRWLERKRTQQLAARRLRVAETISLGEKRFVSILQVDGTQFLIGGSAGNVSLLAILNKEDGVDPRPDVQLVPFAEASR